MQALKHRLIKSQSELTCWTLIHCVVFAVLVLSCLCVTPALANSDSDYSYGKYSISGPLAPKLDIQFTPQMLEAIDSGVPLSLELRLVFITPRWFINNHSLPEQHQFQLTRHALSNRYMVRQNGQSRPLLFATFSGLRDYVRTESLRLFEHYAISHANVVTSENSKPYLRLALNKVELPGPVRIAAFASGQWDFDTGWISWEFAN